ncbi:E3 ubiquitin-protein ligase TRAIP [Harpegnathos saltator]|uniref:E3 ubiquitin-protein ligase TRAIP n=1 Tax=Harpegnathos saltator TaxID=610380 RepID=UPI000948C933|nr:E3 ubiquitin-protein ligase TRAIP [Harpegnathos saltator]
MTEKLNKIYYIIPRNHISTCFFFACKMYIVCTICRDNFIQSDDIAVTRCGHVFHVNCLSRWLTRSNSCPECREKTSQEKTQRLYVTFASNEASNTDNLSTQERIDSLKFQVLLNEKNIKYYTSKNETLEKQNAGLRQEVRKVESEISKKNSTIYLLKEQMKDLKEKYTEYETLKHKLSQKEKEIENLQHMKKLLHGSVMEAEEIFTKSDRDTLVTYMKAMKRDMFKNAKRWELLHKHIKRCLNTQTEVVALVEDQFKKPEMIYDKRLVDNVTDLVDRIYEMEKLILISLKKCQNFDVKSPTCNSPKKLNETFVTGLQTVRTAPSKVENKAVTSACQNRYSISKKRAKLL